MSETLVPLTNSLRSAVIDSSDLGLLGERQWRLTSHGYAYCSRDKIYMHLLIAGAAGFPRVDHRDRDGLNNRRDNLRPCTVSQNTCNSRKRSDNTSGFKGVYFCKFSGRWRADIGVNKRRIVIGRFDTAEAAARARDDAAIKYHGEFAVLNFPIGE